MVLTQLLCPQLLSRFSSILEKMFSLPLFLLGKMIISSHSGLINQLINKPILINHRECCLVRHQHTALTIISIIGHVSKYFCFKSEQNVMATGILICRDEFLKKNLLIKS